MLDSSYFQGLVDQSNSLERIIFTKTDYQDIAESIDTTNDLTILDIIKKVVCNKPHTFSIHNIVKCLLNTNLIHLKFNVWSNAP